MKDIKDIILEVSPYYAKKGEPEAEHTLLYDSAAETLEPVYFFILDLLFFLGILAPCFLASEKAIAAACLFGLPDFISSAIFSLIVSLDVPFFSGNLFSPLT